MEDNLSMSQIGLKKHYEKRQEERLIMAERCFKHWTYECHICKEVERKRTMPLDDWVSEICPNLETALQAHAIEFGIEENHMKGFIRCCMADIRQEYYKDG